MTNTRVNVSPCVVSQRLGLEPAEIAHKSESGTTPHACTMGDILAWIQPTIPACRFRHWTGVRGLPATICPSLLMQGKYATQDHSCCFPQSWHLMDVESRLSPRHMMCYAFTLKSGVGQGSYAHLPPGA